MKYIRYERGHGYSFVDNWEHDDTVTRWLLEEAWMLMTFGGVKVEWRGTP